MKISEALKRLAGRIVAGAGLIVLAEVGKILTNVQEVQTLGIPAIIVGIAFKIWQDVVAPYVEEFFQDATTQTKAKSTASFSYLKL